MDDASSARIYSLHGGPLYRLGCRLGLVRKVTNTQAVGLALAAALWIVFVLLALAEGRAERIFSPASIGSHVRLLVAVPLLFLCESAMDAAVIGFMRSIVTPGVVPPESMPRLNVTLARSARWRDSSVPDAVCLLAAIMLSAAAPHLNLFGTTSDYRVVAANTGLTLTGWWYWAVCLTLFRFLMFRWLWRLILWWHLLWQISRLKLQLVPTHADHAAGLGNIETVHTQFALLIAALSFISAAAFTEGIVSGIMTFQAIYAPVAVLLAMDAILFLGPLFIVSPKLWACREEGLTEYSVLASKYAIQFARKWLRDNPSQDRLLGTSDIQSLADLSSVVETVRRIRLAPLSYRLLMVYAAAALVPMLPLLLFRFPVTELAQRVLLIITGL